MTYSKETVTPVLASELRDFADLLPDVAAAHLHALAERQAKAEKQAGRLLAKRFLSVIEELSEYDDVVASHLLIGLLRVAADQKLMSVERTALRIAGLIQGGDLDLRLAPEATSLLALLSPDLPVPVRLTEDFGTRPADPTPAEAALLEPLVATPFATMRFGSKVYEIADGRSEDRLAFRLQGTEDWTELASDRAAGWDVIGGEILERGSDVLADYIMMHTMRLAAPEVGPNVHHFELSPLRWWLQVEGQTAKLRIEGARNWMEVPADIREPVIRDLGIKAAERLIPDFTERLRDEALSWSRRMAHSATIMPIM